MGGNLMPENTPMLSMRALSLAALTLITSVATAQHPGVFDPDQRHDVPDAGGQGDRQGPIPRSRVTGVQLGDVDELWVGGWNTHNLARVDLATGELIEMFVPSRLGGLLRAHAFRFGPRGNLSHIS